MNNTLQIRRSRALNGQRNAACNKASDTLRDLLQRSSTRRDTVHLEDDVSVA